MLQTEEPAFQRAPQQPEILHNQKIMLSSSSESLSALKLCLCPDEGEELEEKVLEWVGLTVCDFKSEIAFSGMDST